MFVKISKIVGVTILLLILPLYVVSAFSILLSFFVATDSGAYSIARALIILITFGFVIYLWIKGYKKIFKNTTQNNEKIISPAIMKKIIIIGVVVITVTVAGVLIYWKKTTTQQSTSELSFASKIRPVNQQNQANDGNNLISTESLVGHWRNDTEKIDYIFSKNNSLSVVGDADSKECTYEAHKQDAINGVIEVTFNCPQPDWPGYAELHTIEFTSNTTFIDTLYIQGIASRIDGAFTKVGLNQ